MGRHAMKGTAVAATPTLIAICIVMVMSMGIGTHTQARAQELPDLDLPELVLPVMTTMELRSMLKLAPNRAGSDSGLYRKLTRSNEMFPSILSTSSLAFPAFPSDFKDMRLFS